MVSLQLSNFHGLRNPSSGVEQKSKQGRERTVHTRRIGTDYYVHVKHFVLV